MIQDISLYTLQKGVYTLETSVRIVCDPLERIVCTGYSVYEYTHYIYSYILHIFICMYILLYIYILHGFIYTHMYIATFCVDIHWMYSYILCTVYSLYVYTLYIYSYMLHIFIYTYILPYCYMYIYTAYIHIYTYVHSHNLCRYILDVFIYTMYSLQYI